MSPNLRNWSHLKDNVQVLPYAEDPTMDPAMDPACDNITAASCRGWIRHSRRYFTMLHCRTSDVMRMRWKTCT